MISIDYLDKVFNFIMDNEGEFKVESIARDEQRFIEHLKYIIDLRLPLTYPQISFNDDFTKFRISKENSQMA